MRRPKTDRVPRTRAGGTWTEAGFWGFLRSGVRELVSGHPLRALGEVGRGVVQGHPAQVEVPVRLGARRKHHPLLHHGQIHDEFAQVVAVGHDPKRSSSRKAAG